MKKIIVLSFILINSVVSAATIHLSSGESTYVSGQKVVCNSDREETSYWVCTITTSGRSFTGRGETQSAANGEALNSCNETMRYPFCLTNWGAKVSCEKV